MKNRRFILGIIFIVFFVGCQSIDTNGNGQNTSQQDMISIADSEWESNPSVYYKFVDETNYKFCLFYPSNNPDFGTYTLEGNIITFHSIKLNRTWTARIDGNKFIRETGEVYIRRK
jgi:hypothetical protein